jgi:hypothetical protein
MSHTRLFGSVRARHESGQSLVESALVIPLILLMFMGTVDLGRLLFAYAPRPFNAAVKNAIRVRVTSSSDHTEVKFATVLDANVVCVAEDTTTTPPTPGTVKVSATYNLPTLTPLGTVLFGGTFTLGATVTATNLERTC